MAVWAFWGFLPFLAAAFATDLRSMKIPNLITVSALASGLLLQGLLLGLPGLGQALAGALTGFAILLAMYFMGAVGAGDVKLFAAIGAWSGMFFSFQVVIYSVLFGAVIGWMIVLWRREAMRTVRRILGKTAGFLLLRSPGLLKEGPERLRFPFMLAVVPGFLCAYIYY